MSRTAVMNPPRYDDEGLGEPVTVEEILAENLARRAEVLAHETDPERIATLRLPFGFMNGEWNRFCAEVQPGDVIRPFRTGRDLYIRAGYAVVRNGESC